MYVQYWKSIVPIVLKDFMFQRKCLYVWKYAYQSIEQCMQTGMEATNVSWVDTWNFGLVFYLDYFKHTRVSDWFRYIEFHSCFPSTKSELLSCFQFI